MNYLQYAFDHREEILAWVTQIMLFAIAFSHGLLWAAKGARALAMSSSFTWDDEPTKRLLAFASWLDARVHQLAEVHARLFPRPAGATPPTPRYEAVRDERVEQEGPMP